MCIYATIQFLEVIESSQNELQCLLFENSTSRRKLCACRCVLQSLVQLRQDCAKYVTKGVPHPISQSCINLRSRCAQAAYAFSINGFWSCFLLPTRIPPACSHRGVVWLDKGRTGGGKGHTPPAGGECNRPWHNDANQPYVCPSSNCTYTKRENILHKQLRYALPSYCAPLGALLISLCDTQQTF